MICDDQEQLGADSSGCGAVKLAMNETELRRFADELFEALCRLRRDGWEPLSPVEVDSGSAQVSLRCPAGERYDLSWDENGSEMHDLPITRIAPVDPGINSTLYVDVNGTAFVRTVRVVQIQ